MLREEPVFCAREERGDMFLSSDHGRRRRFSGSTSLWLRSQGFEDGDLRTEIESSDGTWRCPVARACEQGELHHLAWLYYNGAASDASRVSGGGKDMRTPIQLACEHGHLDVCKWLVGHTQRAAKPDVLSLLFACENGHMHVCE